MRIRENGFEDYHECWVRLSQAIDFGETSEDTTEVLLVLNKTWTDYRSPVWQKGNGACLVPKGTVQGVLHTTYACGISWGPLARNHPNLPSDATVFEVEYVPDPKVDVLIECGECYSIAVYRADCHS